MEATLSEALALLNAVPAIFNTVATIRSGLAAPDQATLDAAVANAKAKALADEAQAETDLNAAAAS